MCPGYERSHSVKPRRSHGRRDSELAATEDDFRSWVDLPFSSLRQHTTGDSSDSEELGQDHYEEEDDAMEGFSSSRRGRGSYYFDRQMYLHSYPFCRKLSLSDKLKSSLRRLKAAAWAVVACNCRPVAKKFKDKLARSRRGEPFLCSFSCKPRCLRVPA